MECNLNFLLAGNISKLTNLKIRVVSTTVSMATNKQESATKPKPNTKKRSPTTTVIEDIEDFSNEEIPKIRVSLLQWYYQNQRVLPWRINQVLDIDVVADDCRAYAVWVSEIMLQQTRVATVIDYYNRWMEKWPTLQHLAQASQEEVNEMWAGLGYYRRARFLLEGAKMVVEGEGNFPRNVSDLCKVRGIGDYTAGAIASIAFKEAVPVVDGNVVRVIARLKAISANPKESVKSFWKLAGQLVDPSRPGDFNQALMELGSTLCTPTSPGCSTCPVSGQCRALSLSRNHESVKVTNYPIKVVKAKQRHDFCAVCVVEILEDRDSDIQEGAHTYLLIKRPKEGLLAGLWEFPSVLLGGEVGLSMRKQSIDKYLKKSFRIDTKKKGILISREDIGECVHVFTHIRLKMYVELLVLHLKGEDFLPLPLLMSHSNPIKTPQLIKGWKSALSDINLNCGILWLYNL
ncbi:hypothetical protein GIB67_008478 [Kingdonia uniflora]|uniref:Adenine DNA glycosylase n=1 Tax=Kingdonia uniflora TaxID=39325 RepID=A0A7J7N576_9MAGN|nr:hypothetical protein GIB67_008478 [Kingdonia uniflora]